MFSKTAEYALRATIYIAQKSSEEKKLSIEDIAKSIDAPQSFTAKILQLLTKDNRVISSMRGPNGGFFIAPVARQLSIRAVLQAVDEDEVLTKCVLGLQECSEAQPCPLHAQYKHIKQQLVYLFETKTIQDRADGLISGEAFIKNVRRKKGSK